MKDIRYIIRDVNSDDEVLLLREPGIKDGVLKIGDGDHTWAELDAYFFLVDDKLDSSSTRPLQNKEIYNELNNKVDKIRGKQLSTYDYSANHYNKVSKLQINGDGTRFLNNKGEYQKIQVIQTIDVDDMLSVDSTNPVQNKVIADLLISHHVLLESIQKSIKQKPGLSITTLTNGTGSYSFQTNSSKNSTTGNYSVSFGYGLNNHGDYSFLLGRGHTNNGSSQAVIIGGYDNVVGVNSTNSVILTDGTNTELRWGDEGQTIISSYKSMIADYVINSSIIGVNNLINGSASGSIRVIGSANRVDIENDVEHTIIKDDGKVDFDACIGKYTNAEQITVGNKTQSIYQGASTDLVILGSYNIIRNLTAGCVIGKANTIAMSNPNSGITIGYYNKVTHSAFIFGSNLTSTMNNQVLFGKYNNTTKTNLVFAVGWGSSSYSTNLFEIDTQGYATLAYETPTKDYHIATKAYVDQQINKLIQEYGLTKPNK